MLNGGYQCSKKLSTKELFTITEKDKTRNNDSIGSLNKGDQMRTDIPFFFEDECLLVNLSKEGAWFPSCDVFKLKLDAFQETVSQIKVI